MFRRLIRGKEQSRVKDTVRRLGFGGVIGVTALLTTTPASTLPTKDACAGSLGDAEANERSGRLLEAREALLSCARVACGSVLKQKCTARFVRLDSSDIPSIIPRVSDDHGAPIFDVDIRVDGEPLTSHLDGQPLSVNPGLRVLSFSTDRGLYAEQKILVAQGERGRIVVATLRADSGRPRNTPAKQPAPSPNADANPSEHNRGVLDRQAHDQVNARQPSPAGACHAAAAAAEEAEKAAHLRAARESLLACAKVSCGPSLSQTCRARFSRLDAADIPSIVPVVTGAKGQPLVDVELKMDGELLATRLDADEIAVDPGLHVFTFRSDGLQSTQKILIAQGERRRSVRVSLGGASGR